MRQLAIYVTRHEDPPPVRLYTIFLTVTRILAHQIVIPTQDQARVTGTKTITKTNRTTTIQSQRPKTNHRIHGATRRIHGATSSNVPFAKSNHHQGLGHPVRQFQGSPSHTELALAKLPFVPSPLP